MSVGGSKWEGVVFKVNKDGSGYTVLHDFTSERIGGDGTWPQGVVEGSDGTLYGTTQLGGTGRCTVFKVNKDGGDYTVLHRFPGISGDGLEPWAGLAEGRDGALYGTTLQGGTNDAGTVFKLNKDGSGYAVLHSFLASPTDGFRPMAGLLAGSDGALYGTTDGGGDVAGAGTVFKINPDGSGYILLHSFPDKPSDGRFPRSRLLEGREGALYGTTRAGGKNDWGTVFTVNKDGSGYRLLHSFTGYENSGDGAEPSGLALGSDGALYVRSGVGVPTSLASWEMEGRRTTEFHGRNNGGTAFKLNPDGSGFAVLHNFPGAEGDGENPAATMVQGSDGALYGMTKISNTNTFATLFRLSFDASAQHLQP